MLVYEINLKYKTFKKNSIPIMIYFTKLLNLNLIKNV